MSALARQTLFGACLGAAMENAILDGSPVAFAVFLLGAVVNAVGIAVDIARGRQ